MHHTRECPAPLRRAPSQRNYADHDFETFRRRRDGQAFERVMGATSHRLRCAARACTSGDPHVVEELVQATYVAAMDGASSYDTRHPLVPWMIGILHNRARRARKVDRRQPDPRRLAREVPLRDPRDDLVGRELVERVLREIHELPALYRPVVGLHVYLGFTPAEIAAAIERPRSTVRTQLSRGLRRLRGALSRYVADAG